MAMTARLLRQMTLALANHRYKPHTIYCGRLIALKKINLSSGRPGIEESEVCDCGTRRSRFRKRGAFNYQRRLKLMANAFPILCGGASTALFFQLYIGHSKIWISLVADWISTASGSERPLAKAPLATARGTYSSPQSRSWFAGHTFMLTCATLSGT